jgi:hypothetical protein
MKLAPVAVVLLFALAGCGGGGTPTAGDTPGDTGSPSPSETGSNPVDTGDGGPCTRDDLDITYEATDNTAGQMHGILSMTNTAPSACTLSGYPILFLGSGEVEEPVGLQATFDDTPTDEGFPLEPGNVATSNVTITQAGNIDGCDIASTTHMIASPPLDHTFDWVADGRDVPIPETPICYNDDIGLLTVSPLVLTAS